MAIVHIFTTDILVGSKLSTSDGVDNAISQLGYKTKSDVDNTIGGCSNFDVKTSCIDFNNDPIPCEVYLNSFKYYTVPPDTTYATKGFNFSFSKSKDEYGNPTGKAIIPFEEIHMNIFNGLGSNMDYGNGTYILRPHDTIKRYELVNEYENQEIMNWLLKNINNTIHVEMKCITKL